MKSDIRKTTALSRQFSFDFHQFPRFGHDDRGRPLGSRVLKDPATIGSMARV